MTHRSSYRVTTAAAMLGVAATSLLLTYDRISRPANGYWLAVLLLVAAALLIFASIAMGGLICLWRDSRDAAGKQDPFTKWANSPRGPGVMAQLGLRPLQGRSLRPGDIVRVKSYDEIRATLNEGSALDGLPFMPEMRPFCGGTYRVHRRIEKINDMRHKTGLRRMHAAVTLTDVRCCGASHGGCQADCQILWKEAWLEGLPRRSSADAEPSDVGIDGAQPPITTRALTSTDERFYCQLTQLWEASSPMSPFDPRQDCRALLSGNLPLHLFVVGLLTRLFNGVQRLRGGAGYPFMPPNSKSGPTPTVDLGLKPGDRVQVRGVQDISRTLVNDRNRGLWFDREMVRYCGRRAIVANPVHRIIHEATGQMVTMKVPCIVLRDSAATGEFLRFCPQHEHTFWREVWLVPSEEQTDD